MKPFSKGILLLGTVIITVVGGIGIGWAIFHSEIPTKPPKAVSQETTITSSVSKTTSSQAGVSQDSDMTSSEQVSQATSESDVSTPTVASVVWSDLSLTEQIAILIQVAFPMKDGVPDATFDFANNYWAMTGSIDNGTIQRFIPNSTGYAGISDLITADIQINDNDVTVTRPVSSSFNVDLEQAVAQFMDEQHQTHTEAIASHVITPAKLADMQ